MERAQIEKVILEMVIKAKAAARSIGAMPASLKNRVLLETAEALLAQQELILSENAKDMADAEKKGVAPAMLSRLPVSYTHLRAHETDSYLVCRLLLEK